MSDKSNIEWTEATWNPVTGCTKVSQGCKHCYAERDWQRLAAPRAKPNIYTGRDFTDVKCHPEKLEIPLRWNKPRRIFVNSMSDLFHEDVPDNFIDEVFAVMALAGQHVFQVLTKRPKRMLDYFNYQYRWVMIEGAAQAIEQERTGADPSLWMAVNGPLKNVWLGVSCEDQATADERIPLLLQTPAAVRWVSAEPLLGPIDFTRIDYCAESLSYVDALRGSYFCDGLNEPRATPKLNWVIAGGESGPQARPMHPDWVRAIRDQCQAAGVPFFFKQWGKWAPDIVLESGRGNRVNSQQVSSGRLCDSIWMTRFGKKAAGRHLDGRTWDEYPA